MKTLLIPIIIFLLQGCTNVRVDAIDPSVKLSHVCIEDNPKVIVGIFLPVIQSGFTRHGITTEIYKEQPPSHCRHRLTYTALKKWDMALYMHHAELHLFQGPNQIGSAVYHLNGGGGFALNKWASVESKMDPVIDELLAGYSPEVVDAYREDVPAIVPSKSKQSSDQRESLEILKEWYEDGLIGKEEYETEKKRILGTL